MVPLGIIPFMPSTGVKVKLVPLQITVVKLLTAGGADKKTNPDSAAEPPAAVRLSAPVAPEPTTALISLYESTWNDATGTPPSEILVISKKLSPVIVIEAPVPALVGVKEVMVGDICVDNSVNVIEKVLPIQMPALGVIK